MIHTNKITLFLSSLLLLNFLTPIHAGMAPMSSAPSSEQDMNHIVQELEKATKEIDTFVKALPPAEQEEFNRIVQQVESKMSQTDPAVLERFLTNQMNPEELDQFLGNVFEGINPPDLKPAEEIVPSKPAPKKEEKATPKEISKLDRALETINAIIKRTDSFVVKSQALPELAAKVKRWGKKGILYDWESSFDWNKVKKDIETLRQALEKMIEKDPKNGTYKYLNDFIAQDTLVNNVEKLKTTLVEYEPTIEASIFGLEKMDPTAKKALTRTISGYTEALYRLKITDDLNKIFEKYEPRAKELREEKEKAEKNAEIAGQRSRYAGRQEMVMAGSSESGGDYYSGYTPETSDYSNYYGGSSPSYEPSSYDYSSPSNGSSSSKADGEEATNDKGGGKSGGEDKGGKSDKDKGGKSGKKEDKGEKSDKDKSDKDKSDKEPAKKESEPIEKSLKEITDSINIAGLTTKLDKTLGDIKNHILDTESKPEAYPVNLVLENLQKAERSVKTMKQEIDKKFDMQVATRVQKRLDDMVKEHKPVFEKVIKQIKEIEAIDAVTRNEKIAAEKRVAFLGEQPTTPVKPKAPKGSEAALLAQVEEALLEQLETVDLFALPKAWDMVQKSIKDITKKPAPKSEPAQPGTPAVAPADSTAPVASEESEE